MMAEEMPGAVLVITGALRSSRGRNLILEEAGIKLPMFVCCLFAGIILTNVAPLIKKDLDKDSDSRIKVRALFSDLSLGVFLAMSLMSLQLWNLIDLAGAIFVILVAHVRPLGLGNSIALCAFTHAEAE